jgi:hypothetical protein
MWLVWVKEIVDAIVDLQQHFPNLGMGDEEFASVISQRIAFDGFFVHVVT